LKKSILLLLLCFIPGIIFAQESNNNNLNDNNSITNDNLENIFNSDFEDIFDQGASVTDSLNRPRITFNISFNFYSGFSPGWNQVPWYNGENEYTYLLGIMMESLISLDFQLSKNLRVYNSFYFSIPANSNNFLAMKEFYFDYDFRKIIFIRGGQDTVAWGISPFFPFTNLPSRIPAKISGGDSYVLKIDIPIGLGGVQLLGLTRYGFMENKTAPGFNEIAWGLKYNLALQAVDIDCGFFYFEKMPLRFFTSVKTTLGKTELYAEGLIATKNMEWDDLTFSGNIGFLRDFFNGILTIGGEVFYNGEKDAYWYRTKEDLREAESVLLFEDLNGALNVIARPGIINMRVFCQCLYAYKINSYQLIPGLSIKPMNQINVSLMVPMALGSRENNSYYRHTIDAKNRPFSVIFLVSMGGNFRYRIYMDRSAN